jgi:hypothetical protein
MVETCGSSAFFLRGFLVAVLVAIAILAILILRFWGKMKRTLSGSGGQTSRVTKMRIVVWNCRMGFGKKRDILYALKPDISVIPECSQDAVNLCAGDGYSGCWWGDKKHKGLALPQSSGLSKWGDLRHKSGSPQLGCEGQRTFSYLPFGLAQLVR